MRNTRTTVGQAGLLTLSLVLNAALAVSLLRSTAPSTAAPHVTDEDAQSHALTANRSAPEAHLNAVTGEAPTHLATPATPFHWSQIESADYRQYIANLRAVGCPEPTIRDMIAADLTALYSARAGTIFTPKPREYWQKARPDTPNAEQRKQLVALAREQDAVFRELLGGHYPQQERIDTLFLQLQGNGRQLLFLPADKRATALGVLAEVGLDTRELEVISQGRYSQTQIQDFFDDKLNLLARVLAPSELEEFRLRNSPQAEQLRVELQYFDCTPDEFKQILDARQQSKSKVATNDLLNRSPATAQIRELFGDARAEEFERVTDLYYQNARRATEQFDLPTELADQAWQVCRDARASADQVAQNNVLSADQRRQQVQALQAQADRRLADLLGESPSRALCRDLKVVLDCTEAGIQP